LPIEIRCAGAQIVFQTHVDVGHHQRIADLLKSRSGFSRLQQSKCQQNSDSDALSGLHIKVNVSEGAIFFIKTSKIFSRFVKKPPDHCFDPAVSELYTNKLLPSLMAYGSSLRR
jgi:hypothetical protein